MKQNFLKQLRKLCRPPWWKRLFNFLFRRKRPDISVSASGTKFTEEIRVGDYIWSEPGTSGLQILSKKTEDNQDV